jgi:predicted unusual protein kinase regulating ubiquinone biosynthesis (AarF/ABC1/UbiB family)
VEPAVLEVWRTSLAATGQHMLEALRETTQAAVADLQAQQKDQQQCAAQLLQVFGQKTQEATDMIRGGTEAAIQAIAGGMTGLAAEVKGLQTEVSAHRQGLAQLLEQNAALNAEQHRVLVEGVGRQLDLIASSKTALESLAQTTQAAVASQASIRQAMADLAEADLKQMFGSFAEALRTQTLQLQQLNHVLSGLAQGTERMVDSHTKLQAATRELHETGLGQSLTSVRDSLAALRPVLEGFRGPFVFQAVPVADGHEERH